MGMRCYEVQRMGMRCCEVQRMGMGMRCYHSGI